MKIDYNKTLYIVAFDLDTKLLSSTFGEKNYRKVYNTLRKMFKHYGFDHKQGSVYVTNDEKSYKNILNLTTFLIIKRPFIGRALKVIDCGTYYPQLSFAEQIRNASNKVINEDYNSLEIIEEVENIFSFLEEINVNEAEEKLNKIEEKGDFTIEEK